MQRHISDNGVELLIVDGRPVIRGECDLSNAQAIETWLNGFRGPVELDLSGVTFLDAAALRALLAAARDNPHLRIVAPSRAVQRLLELTDTWCLARPEVGY